MKYIRKGKEPEEFTNWKNLENDDWKPNWDDNFQAPEKPIVHESLLREQGYICCYFVKQLMEFCKLFKV